MNVSGFMLVGRHVHVHTLPRLSVPEKCDLCKQKEQLTLNFK